jgi:hypothetical protein
MGDYVSSFSRQGNANYKALAGFSSRSGIDIGACMNILGGCLGGSLKSGEFVVTTMDHAHSVLSVCDSICRFEKWGKHHTTVMSVHQVIRYSDASVPTLVDRINANSGRLRQPVNTDDGIAMLESIYNMRSRDLCPIAMQVKARLKLARAVQLQKNKA